MSPTLPLTAAMSPLAAQVGHDLTLFAMREQAFNEMVACAFKFDGSYEAAKARFDALAKDARR